MAKRPPRRSQQPRRQRGMPTLEFHDDPAELLKAAREYLSADPVLTTVVTTNADEHARRDAAGVEHGLPHRWWVVVRDDVGAVSGVAMRTAPFAPYPLYVLPMPADAAAALAHLLHAQGERVDGVFGALPAAKLCAGELARLSGRTATTGLHTRLHEVRRVIDPPPAPGRLRTVREDEVELVLGWLGGFAHDVDEQAGRELGHHHELGESRDGLLREIAEERLWFWADEDDRPVHLTGHRLPVLGAVRIGPVYTPAEQRGKGYAGNAVASVSRRLLAGGSRVCLNTDQANPHSNRLYAALGYEPVVDMVEMRIG